MSTAIVRSDATLQARAGRWVDLAIDERRRLATAAAQAKDPAELWSLLEAYLATYGAAGAKLSPHTLRSYRGGLTAFLSYANTQAFNLIRPGRDAGARWLRYLEAEGHSPATVRVRLAALRMLYRALRWAGASEADPFADVHPARDATAPWDKRSPYLHADVERLLNTADPKDRVLILLCAHGGLRVSEAIALTWADIDLHRHMLIVKQGKGGKQRPVVLSERLRSALEAVGPAEGRLLRWSDVRARARLEAVCTRAGVPYKGVHALRHYAGTRLMQQTGNLEHVARHLGHSSIETARIYAKWSDETLREALSEW
ncbi:MAG: tyrosine-type recombinase/integrase [Chloroflexota bacterium]|nr:tyrosine-type recombinase/integrase [Chloroflexota bacterium]